MVLDVTKENFTEVINGNDIVVVDFWAPWCGPCKSFAPVFEAAAEANSDAAFVKVNTEDQQELAGTFGIRSIPSVLFCPTEGQPRMSVGALPKEGYEKAMKDVFEVEKPSND